MRTDLLHITSAFVPVSASQPTTALQPSIYSFTATYGFIAITCNLVVGGLHSGTRIGPNWYGLSAGQAQEPAHPGGKVRQNKGYTSACTTNITKILASDGGAVSGFGN